MLIPTLHAMHGAVKASQQAVVSERGGGGEDGAGGEDEPHAAYAAHKLQLDGALEHMDGVLTQLASGAVEQYEKAMHGAYGIHSEQDDGMAAQLTGGSPRDGRGGDDGAVASDGEAARQLAQPMQPAHVHRSTHGRCSELRTQKGRQTTGGGDGACALAHASSTKRQDARSITMSSLKVHHVSSSRGATREISAISVFDGTINL